MKSITNIFKNKIVVAVICFVIAMIIAFIIVPSKNHDGERVNVIKVTKTISANTKITDDMLKEVNVPAAEAKAITDYVVANNISNETVDAFKRRMSQK